MTRNLGSLGNNLQRIIQRLTTNQNLLKLLYYTDKDPLSQPDLTQLQIKEEVFEKLIKIIPRIGDKEDASSIIILNIASGISNVNDEFKDIRINLEVYVPLTQWIIKNTNLRPFCILGEIDKSLNNKTVDGLGKIVGGNFSLNFLSGEISCYIIEYLITTYD